MLVKYKQTKRRKIFQAVPIRCSMRNVLYWKLLALPLFIVDITSGSVSSRYVTHPYTSKAMWLGLRLDRFYTIRDEYESLNITPLLSDYTVVYQQTVLQWRMFLVLLLLSVVVHAILPVPDFIPSSALSSYAPFPIRLHVIIC